MISFSLWWTARSLTFYNHLYTSWKISHTRSEFTLVSLLSLFLLRLYEMFRRCFDFLDPCCPRGTINTHSKSLYTARWGYWWSVRRCQCARPTSHSRCRFWECRRDRCARRGRAARRWTGRAAFSPRPRWETVAGEENDDIEVKREKTLFRPYLCTAS